MTEKLFTGTLNHNQNKKTTTYNRLDIREKVHSSPVFTRHQFNSVLDITRGSLGSQILPLKLKLVFKKFMAFARMPFYTWFPFYNIEEHLFIEYKRDYTVSYQGVHQDAVSNCFSIW